MIKHKNSRKNKNLQPTIITFIIITFFFCLSSTTSGNQKNIGIFGSYNKLEMFMDNNKIDPSYSIGILGDWYFNKYFGTGFLLTLFEKQIFSVQTADTRNASINNTLTTLTLYGSGGIRFWDIRLMLFLGPKIGYLIDASIKVEQDTVDKREFLSQQNRVLFHGSGGIGIDYHLNKKIILTLRSIYNITMNDQLITTQYNTFSNTSGINSLQFLAGVSLNSEVIFPTKKRSHPSIKITSEKLLSPNGDGKNDEIELQVECLKPQVNKKYYIVVKEKESNLIIYNMELGKEIDEKEIIWRGQQSSGKPLVANSNYILELFLDKHRLHKAGSIEVHVPIYLPQMLIHGISIQGIEYKLKDFTLTDKSRTILSNTMKLINNREVINSIKVVLYAKKEGMYNLNKIIQEKFAQRIANYLNSHNPKKKTITFEVKKSTDKLINNRKNYIELHF